MMRVWAARTHHERLIARFDAPRGVLVRGRRPLVRGRRWRRCASVVDFMPTGRSPRQHRYDASERHRSRRPAPSPPTASRFSRSAPTKPSCTSTIPAAAISEPWGFCPIGSRPGEGRPAPNGPVLANRPARSSHQIHSFLFIASAALFVPSFTAALVSPVPFWPIAAGTLPARAFYGVPCPSGASRGGQGWRR
jgi:hypothetical protein